MYIYPYYVPATLLVLAWVSSVPKILARPKSDIFGLISSSKRNVAGFQIPVYDTQSGVFVKIKKALSNLFDNIEAPAPI